MSLAGLNWGRFLMTFGGWIATTAVTALLFIFLFLTKEASMPLFRARIKGQPVVLLQRKDERYGLVTGTYEQGGVDLGKWGHFIVNKGQFKPFGGTTLGQAKEGFAAFPTSEYVEATNELKDNGYETLEDILDDQEVLEQKAADGDKLAENVLGHLAVIEDYNTAALSPVHIKEKIDHEAEKKRKRMKDNPLQRLLIYAIAAAIVITPFLLMIYFKQCPDFAEVCHVARTAGGSAPSQVPM